MKKAKSFQRVIAWLLLICICVSLCACKKSEAAQAVDEQIAAIGEITLESEQSIKKAEEAVNALSEKDRKQLERLDELTQMRATYEELVREEEAARIEAETKKRNEEIAAVEAAISNIGTVTLDKSCVEAISKARRLYDASASDVQAGVKNLSVLEAAETEQVKLQAENVMRAIDAIGEVTQESGEKIAAAERLVDSLPKQVVENVTNLQVLKDAKKKFQEARKAQAESLLETFALEDDAVRRMKFYSSKKTPYYANTRSYVLPYIGMNQTNYIWLCAKFHYTGDSWIFFDKITFAIDDARIVKLFKRSDITRDNGSGDIWEVVNTADGDQYKDLFWEIANSETTIVRFEGDDHHYDLTVSDSDKQAIREILTAYEALLDSGAYKSAN